MEYKVYNLPIRDLIKLIEKNEIDLKPAYQRNEVWSKKDQESLIDSILANLPIQNFFFFKNPNGMLEMVDGQQRARAIYNFYKELITDSEKRKITDINIDDFLNYKIIVTEIIGSIDNESIRRFYVLVNKKGVQLNTPEIHKAEFASTNFMHLVQELLENQVFSDFELFTDATSKRMNDRSYVEELAAYLLLGITDKKLAVEKIFENDITKEDYQRIKLEFESIMTPLSSFDNFLKLRKTRYKQRNDFYTLFSFIHQGLEKDSESTMLYQYKILITLDRFITPSNEECEPLQKYAFNCISQSNSKKARLERLNFFNAVLRNKEVEENKIFQDVANFLIDRKVIKSFKKIESYILFDLEND